jgi:hypothetical protein
LAAGEQNSFGQVYATQSGMKNIVKGIGTRSQFMTAWILPVHHTERETRFGVMEGIMALAFICGTVALMRLVLVIMSDGTPFH